MSFASTKCTQTQHHTFCVPVGGLKDTLIIAFGTILRGLVTNSVSTTYFHLVYHKEMAIEKSKPMSTFY